MIDVPASSKAQSMIAQAYKQQQLTGKKDADVIFVVKGKWPDSGKKRLLGKHGGPLGTCVAEFEFDCLVLFKADQVISFLAKFLPVMKIEFSSCNDDEVL